MRRRRKKLQLRRAKKRKSNSSLFKKVRKEPQLKSREARPSKKS